MTKTRERTRRIEKPKGRLLKALADKAAGASRSSGRNSAGRITSFHRGGGSKRIHRKVDLKRDVPATGVVERIEYDPTRSSRVALVRWVDGVNNLLRGRRQVDTLSVSPSTPSGEISSIADGGNVTQPHSSPPAGKVLESPTISSSFSLASLSGKSGQSIVPRSPSQAKDYVLIGGVPKQAWIKQEDVKMEAESSSISFNFPRIAVVGAKPSFFAPTGEDLIGRNVSLREIQRWRNRSIERKSAIPWQSLGLSDALKPKLDKGGNLLPTQVISYALSSRARQALSNNNGNASSMPAKTIVGSKGLKDCVPVSYIIASDKLEEGKTIMNCDWSKPSLNDDSGYERLDLNSQVGNCIPLKDIRMGTWVHDIEIRPGQGAKLVRAAGTYAKVIKEQDSKCLVRLPSGVEKLIDSKCRATVGVVSNADHGAHKLRKAGQSRWLGRRPVVRGVAMNPIDHPHGGGEGRTSGGRPSVSPWGKPTKGGFKTVLKVVGKGRV